MKLKVGMTAEAKDAGKLIRTARALGYPNMKDAYIESGEDYAALKVKVKRGGHSLDIFRRNLRDKGFTPKGDSMSVLHHQHKAMTVIFRPSHTVIEVEFRSEG